MSQAHNARTSAMEERQLKPIYEALETGNVKSALTTCNKLLQKKQLPTTNRQLITALKILSLVRANKLDEASTLTTALLAETPIDESVLSTLGHSLKPLDRPKDLIGMWTKAWDKASKEVDEIKKKAKSKSLESNQEYQTALQRAEELGAQAFMAMVRTGHWALAQSTAFKLYRNFSPPKGADIETIQSHPSLRYLYWSASAALMQAQYPSPPAPVPVLVMIPPPPAVREWEEAKRKEEEEDKKLIEQAKANGEPPVTNGDATSQSKLTPTRRKKRALALSLAQRIIAMNSEIKPKEGEEAKPLWENDTFLKGMSLERFWLWANVLKTVAEANAEDAGLTSDSPRTEEWQKALTLVSSPLGNRAADSSLHVEELRAEVARKAGDWRREGEGLGMRLNKGDRNWRTFTTFMDAVLRFQPKNEEETANPETYLRLIPKSPAPKPNANGSTAPAEGEGAEKAEEKANEEQKEEKEEPKPLTIENTRAFFRDLAEADESAHPGRERAGSLARIEFEKKIRAANLENEQAADFVSLLKSYFDIYGGKSVVVEDLLGYLPGLNEAESADWSQYLEGFEKKTDDVTSVQRTINILKLQRLLSSSSSTAVASEIEFAKQCAPLYHAALPLGANLVATELQPADDLAILAACALINAHHLSLQNQDALPTTPEETQALLFDTVTLLEYVSQKSRWCHASRFLLVRLYRLLGAPSLAYQNYNMANLKSIQHDTLSHNILSRASIFSLGSAGDLTLINECVESSQVYSVNSVDTAEQLVKAFQYERYSQVLEFVLLEEAVENSFQRDLTKLEHFRMRNFHEGLSPETVEVELVELRYVWARVHHDNRDFDLFPNYQPQGAPSIEQLTNIGNGRLTKQWFSTMLKLWILILHQASEQLWTADEQARVLPDLSVFDEADQESLTTGEKLLVSFSRRLLNWLAPHHAPIKHSVMTNAVSVLSAAVAKQAASTNQSSGGTTPSSGAPKGKSATGKKANGLSNGIEGTAASGAGDGAVGVKVGDMKVVTGMLTLHEPMEVPSLPEGLGEPVKEAPEELGVFFDDLQKLFDDVRAKPTTLPWETLHIAQLVHEAAFITHLLTARFALAVGKKKTHPNYKPLRAKSLAVLDHVAKALSQIGETDFTAEARKQWLQARRASGVLEELTDEHIISVGKNLMESKKKMFEQLGKGMTRAQTTIAKAAAGIPAGSS